MAASQNVLLTRLYFLMIDLSSILDKSISRNVRQLLSVSDCTLTSCDIKCKRKHKEIKNRSPKALVIGHPDNSSTLNVNTPINVKTTASTVKKISALCSFCLLCLLLTIKATNPHNIVDIYSDVIFNLTSQITGERQCIQFSTCFTSRR